MAVRVRKDGRILCAAMHPAEEGDCYVDASTTAFIICSQY